MTEWEVLLFVCIVGMALLATIAFLFGKIGGSLAGYRRLAG